MNTTRIKTILFDACLCLSVCLTACDDKYGDDLRQIGSRVEVLEDSVLAMNNDLEALQRIVAAVESNGFITRIVQNVDGSTTLWFNDNHDPITLHNGSNGSNGVSGRDGIDGKDGLDASLLVSVKQDTDGVYYWTFNGDWLLTDDGQKVRAGAQDGKDGIDGKDGVDGKDGQDGVDGKDGHNGKDGHDGHDGKDGRNGVNGKDGKDADPLSDDVILPQVRINAITRLWEISLDGGKTWRNTGVEADGRDGKDGLDGLDGRDGKDGKDGENGRNGRDGRENTIFDSVSISPDKSTATFYLKDGTTFIVKIVMS